MKLNIEQIIELTGSAPPEQEGKEVVGLENKEPCKGDVYAWGKRWLEAVHSHSIHSRLVAIYEDTHREDGTPMELPQPEFEGYRAEYGGLGMTELKGANAYAVFHENRGLWSGVITFTPTGNPALHHARLYKIAQPTRRNAYGYC